MTILSNRNDYLASKWPKNSRNSNNLCIMLQPEETWLKKCDTGNGERILANLHKDFIYFFNQPYLGEDPEELSDTKYTFKKIIIDIYIFITALSRYNALTIKFAYLKCTIQWF